MNRLRAVFLSLAAAGWASSLPAQSVQPGAATPLTKPPPVAPAPEKRAVSPDVAAMLAVGMPKYAPPKPEPKPEEEGDLRDIDKPKNGIVRLPKYVVHAEKPAVFRDRNIYTDRGLDEFLLQHYQGLGIVPLSGMNAKIGRTLYEDEARQQNMSDLQDTADAMRRGGDVQQSNDIKRWSYDTYARGFDWGSPTPTNPSAQPLPGGH